MNNSVSNNASSISSLFSSITSLSNRVTTLSNSVSSFVNDIWILKNLYVGNSIEIPLTGTNTGTYTFKCCYQNDNIRYFYCIDILNKNTTWEEACNCSWTATINGYIISDIRIPTKDQLNTTISYLGDRFNRYYPIFIPFNGSGVYIWTSTEDDRYTADIYMTYTIDNYVFYSTAKSYTHFDNHDICANPFIVLDTSIFK